jgi:hypothetical protein
MARVAKRKAKPKSSSGRKPRKRQPARRRRVARAGTKRAGQGPVLPLLVLIAILIAIAGALQARDASFAARANAQALLVLGPEKAAAEGVRAAKRDERRAAEVRLRTLQ